MVEYSSTETSNSSYDSSPCSSKETCDKKYTNDSCDGAILITPESCETSNYDSNSCEGAIAITRPTCENSTCYDSCVCGNSTYKKVFVFEIRKENDKSVIYVNGKRKPILRLKRKVHYTFDMKNLEHEVVLTMNPVGYWNGKAPKTISHVENHHEDCNLELYCDEHLPKFFYYQCVDTQFSGGLVIVD